MTRYQNPILRGCFPDPSVCRVGGDYYLATSSFEYFPGVPILRSRDLLHWEHIGHALSREAQLDLRGQASSKGIFAPTLRHHAGVFYLVTTNVGGRGNFYVTATDAKGPWSDPVWLDEPEGWMDPSLFFDDDGKVYYTRHHGGRHGCIVQAELDLGAGKLLSAPEQIWAGTGGVWPEGPHLYKVGGHYYLLISEGGTSYEHALTIARSRSPWGPFEAHPRNPILTHRAHPNHPIQAVGHADLVCGPTGAWFIVFLGVRPAQPNHHHLGRETFLAPVTWDDQGWPVVNGGQPIGSEMEADLGPLSACERTSPRDDFDGPCLRPDYEFVRSPMPSSWSLTERPGVLRLQGNAHSLDDVAAPAFVGRRQQEFRARVSTSVEFEPNAARQEAGLAVRADENNHYEFVITRSEHDPGRVALLRTRINGNRAQSAAHTLPDGAVELRIEAHRDRYDFFVCRGQGLPSTLVGSAPTEPLSAESRALGFTGVRIGLYACSHGAAAMPPADFHYFEIASERG